jgi:hypothetical protein
VASRATTLSSEMAKITRPTAGAGHCQAWLASSAPAPAAAEQRHWPGDTAHTAGMGGSYVAMLTAFYVDNGKQLPVWDRLPTITYWLLPAAVGAR